MVLPSPFGVYSLLCIIQVWSGEALIWPLCRYLTLQTGNTPQELRFGDSRAAQFWKPYQILIYLKSNATVIRFAIHVLRYTEILKSTKLIEDGFHGWSYQVLNITRVKTHWENKCAVFKFYFLHQRQARFLCDRPRFLAEHPHNCSNSRNVLYK